MIGVLILAAVVLAWRLIPPLVERSSRGGPSEEAELADIAEVAPELDVEAPARGVGRAPAAPGAEKVSGAAMAEAGAPAAGWIAELAAAQRGTSRSPFQRKYEGLGKVFIRSRPSGAEILINGIPVGVRTDYLMPVSFPPGRYLLELKKEGYNPYVTDLVIPKGHEDFEEITTVNAALRKKEEASAQEAQRNILYVRARPDLTVPVIMYGGDRSNAVIACRRASGGWMKWVVENGDEIELTVIQKSVTEEPGIDALVALSWFYVGEDQAGAGYGVDVQRTPRRGRRAEVQASRQHIRIVKISSDFVTIRNLLVNLDYDIPLGSGSTWSPHYGGAKESEKS